jgi:hypothetical protein
VLEELIQIANEIRQAHLLVEHQLITIAQHQLLIIAQHQLLIIAQHQYLIIAQQGQHIQLQGEPLEVR